MRISERVQRVLSYYDSESPAVLTNIARMLMHGSLAGTGKLLILPVDQGFEHGPTKSFGPNPSAYDPCYHYELAINCGFSAYAAHVGNLECGARKYAGSIPTILKLNGSTALHPKASAHNQAVTASVKDALYLGCVAVGITIYPGSSEFLSMVEEARELVREAKSYGLASVVWSYPRGGDLSKQGETAVDVVAYAAYIAASIGANVIKVKLPTAHVERDAPECDVSSLSQRVSYVKKSCFAGRRLVVFSGGSVKTDSELLDEVLAIKSGGGDGSIIGRNSFQREAASASALMEKISQIYAAA